MLTDKFFEVLNYEGAVSITTVSNNEAHVNCTWNSYLLVKDDTILIPAAGMKTTSADIEDNGNSKVILTLAAREVEGFDGYQGTGFRIIGEGRFIDEGSDFDEMKEKFPFLNRVLAVDVKECKQLL